MSKEKEFTNIADHMKENAAVIEHGSGLVAGEIDIGKGQTADIHMRYGTDEVNLTIKGEQAREPGVLPQPAINITMFDRGFSSAFDKLIGVETDTVKLKFDSHKVEDLKIRPDNYSMATILDKAGNPLARIKGVEHLELEGQDGQKRNFEASYSFRAIPGAHVGSVMTEKKPSAPKR